MAGVETRNRTRESLFMFANVQPDGVARMHRVRVRNLSSSGMMGVGNLLLVRGARLTIQFRNMVPFSGHVAWVQGERFGVAFDEEIDSEQLKLLNAGSGQTSRWKAL